MSHVQVTAVNTTTGKVIEKSVPAPSLVYITPEEHEELLQDDPTGRLKERHFITDIEGVTVTCDNFGHLRADEELLSRRVATVVEDYSILVRYRPSPHFAGNEKREERKARVKAGKCCGNCAFFDHEEGLRWLNEPTHTFLDGSTKAMNVDIVAMTANDHLKRIIPPSDIGYCPVQERITTHEAPVCGKENLED